ncbi:MAG: hypothetical protein Q9Q40_09480 [Acidobacteriota bacterium]|nr:hypothetical protein [Acidobacteriota bacterium]
MTTTIACRRADTRHRIEPGANGRVEFGYPFPGGEPCTMPLRDISASGVSFLISRELPGLEEGRSLDRVAIRLRGRTVHADLLVMHLTPDPGPGSVCGALIYPLEDEDIRELHALLAGLEAEKGLS